MESHCIDQLYMHANTCSAIQLVYGDLTGGVLGGSVRYEGVLCDDHLTAAPTSYELGLTVPVC